jgi:hypothetical protein
VLTASKHFSDILKTWNVLSNLDKFSAVKELARPILAMVSFTSPVNLLVICQQQRVKATTGHLRDSLFVSQEV